MRIDGKGGSRIVPCPECGAPKGEHCFVGGTARRHYRTQSHPRRVDKARSVVEKRERAKRMTADETRGARAMLHALIESSPYVDTAACERGMKLAYACAFDAIDKLIRTRGAR